MPVSLSLFSIGMYTIISMSASALSNFGILDSLKSLCVILSAFLLCMGLSHIVLTTFNFVLLV